MTNGVHIGIARAHIQIAGAPFSICWSAVGQTQHCRNAHCDCRNAVLHCRSAMGLKASLSECVVALPERVIRISKRCWSDKVLPERILALSERVFNV
ncbi:hypothetical protein AMTR_s00017p00238490 [Amborella trichopoda]|uniref:Uncharacterized protein n=1 Tax=Amborella trichopoda TaxID=13333 RepID=W1PL28_AMBTC|nr:hypothetical protein AMTR_s00017p00238490 [Amborella trichopoda]